MSRRPPPPRPAGQHGGARRAGGRDRRAARHTHPEERIRLVGVRGHRRLGGHHDHCRSNLHHDRHDHHDRDKASFTVLVANASGTSGAAGRLSEKMQADGFTMAQPVDGHGQGRHDEGVLPQRLRGGGRFGRVVPRRRARRSRCRSRSRSPIWGRPRCSWWKAATSRRRRPRRSATTTTAKTG